MSRRFNRSGPPRGRSSQPPQRGAGARGQPPRSASAPVTPPRDRADAQCVNCNRKGHTAQECRQPKVDKSQRKCFLCDKPGHLARDCRERKAPIQAVQQQTREAVFLGCVQTADKVGFVGFDEACDSRKPILAISSDRLRIGNSLLQGRTDSES